MSGLSLGVALRRLEEAALCPVLLPIKQGLRINTDKESVYRVPGYASVWSEKGFS